VPSLAPTLLSFWRFAHTGRNNLLCHIRPDAFDDGQFSFLIFSCVIWALHIDSLLWLLSFHRIIPYCIPGSVFLRVVLDGYLIILRAFWVSLLFSYGEETKSERGNGAESCEVSRECAGCPLSVMG